MRTSISKKTKVLRGLPIAQGFCFSDLTVIAGGFSDVAGEIFTEHFSIIDEVKESMDSFAKRMISLPETEKGALAIFHPEAWAETSDLPDIANRIVDMVKSGYQTVVFTQSSDIMGHILLIRILSSILSESLEKCSTVREVFNRLPLFEEEEAISAFFVERGKILSFVNTDYDSYGFNRFRENIRTYLEEAAEVLDK